MIKTIDDHKNELNHMPDDVQHVDPDEEIVAHLRSMRARLDVILKLDLNAHE